MKWLIFSFLALGFLTVSFANPKPQNEEYGLVDDGGDDGFDDYDDIINDLPVHWKIVLTCNL